MELEMHLFRGVQILQLANFEQQIFGDESACQRQKMCHSFRALFSRYMAML
jgi:hypothetical protein